MLQNIGLSLHLTLPIFMYLGLGILLNVLKLLRKSWIQFISKSVYWVFIPLLLFMNIYQSDLATAFNAKLFGIGLGFLALITMISLSVLSQFPIASTQKPIILQAIYRSNITLFTLPILSLFYAANTLSSMSLFVVFLVPFFNLVAVIALKRYSESSLNPWHILKEVFKNPLIGASLLGLFLNLIKLRIPSFALTSLETLKQFSNPIAMMSVGTLLNFTSFKNNRRWIASLTLIRLLLVPFLAFMVAWMAKLSATETVGLVLAFAAPSPSVMAQMADHYHSDVDLATQLILVTVLTSSLSLPLWISIFLQFNLL